jgi:type IV secretion system protein VirD4
MELNEYRSRRMERSTRAYAGAAAAAGLADVTAETFFLDRLQAQLLELPWHGGLTVTGLSLGAIGLTIYTQNRRQGEEARLRALLASPEWAGRKTRREYIGQPAARRLAKIARPDLTWWERQRAVSNEIGIPIGRTIAGPRGQRKKPIVLPFETSGMLVLGEPGSRKSTFLAGIVASAPGAEVVVSTKPEFITGCAKARASVGPLYVYAPLSTEHLPAGIDVQPFRFALVKGCRDATVAQRVAQSLMDATVAAGLANSDFWTSKGRAVMTALLCAADFAGGGLRLLSSWIQREEFDEPASHLRRNAHLVEDAMINTLAQLTRSRAGATTGSVAQTASKVLEFLQSGAVADSLDAPRDEAVDLEEFIHSNGTLFMVTDSSPALAPVMAAIWAAITRAAKNVAREQTLARPVPWWRGKNKEVQPRLSRPLLCVIDEADKTLPGVPLDSYAAEQRGWGLFTVAATQNRSRLKIAWGHDAATALEGSLQTHVLLSINNQQDREHYSHRIGSRRVAHVRISESSPSTLSDRVFGNPSKDGHSRSMSFDDVTEPLWPAEMFSWLANGNAIVVPPKGACTVVDLGNGWDKAAALGDAADAQNAYTEFAEREDALAARRTAERTAENGARAWENGGGA